jgi:AcrR family transcriptional regulator
VTKAQKRVRAAQQRSADTRVRILAAARVTFAREGYERATLRAIAEGAEADPALIIRYFGSKEGLFVAAVDFELRLPELSKMPRHKLGAAVVKHFLARWEGDPSDRALQILLRTAVTNEGAAERMRNIFARQLLPAVSEVAPGAEARLRAALIATQILGLALCRYVLKLPAVSALTPEEIVAWYGPTVQRYLTGSKEVKKDV